MKKIIKIWFDSEKMYAEFARNRVKSVELNRFPRLRNATAEQRNDWYQLYDGLRWESIDEDIHIGSFSKTGSEKNLIRF